MAKFNFVKGTQNKTLKIFLQDSSKTDGSGLVGLVAPASNLATPVNAAFSTATTGGTLAPGTYYYRVVATNALGKSLPSLETSIVVPAGTSTNTITVNWGSVTNATGYDIEGRLQNGELFIASVGAVTTYVDTGSITPSGAIPTLSAVGLTCYYAREGANASVAVTLANAVLGTYQSGGFIAVDNTNMPGLYELGIPNAALAAGATSIVLMLKGASNLAPYLAEIQLDATDNQDATHGGLTSLPNVAAGAAGGLPTATNASGQVVASSVAGAVGSVTAAVTTDVSATVGTIATSVTEIAGDTDTLITGQGSQATATALGNLQTTATEIAGDTDTIITNQGAQATATALSTAQTGITEIAGDTDSLITAVASTATPANIATALANAGVSAARMQLLDASVGTWSRNGNVITMHTVDNAHVFTATFDDITNPLTCTVVQVS